jgi:hypothetical protein
MAATLPVSAPVHRVLARDDLLLLAEDAQRAVGIVRETERLAREVRKGADLFAVALEDHMGRAKSPRFAVRIQALDYAATLIRFCQLLGIPLGAGQDPTALHELALETVSSTGKIGFGAMTGRDLTLEVLLTYRAVRNYRLATDYQKAIDLARARPDDLFASGGQPLFGHFQYEKGASLLMRGQPGQVNRALSEAGQTYWDTTAGGRMTRHRLDLVLALAAAEQGKDTEAVSRLNAARDHLRVGRPEHEEPGVQDLTVTLALAEQLARGELVPARVREAVALGGEALTITEGIRSRWKVIARARTPLAIVFRRIYGDIALLASRLPGRAAAELGFRVALSAKQTGFATRMREGSLIEGNPVLNLIEDIMQAEDRRPTLATTDADAQQGELAVLWEELKDKVSPMLADTILPPAADITELLEWIGDRCALDFAALPDTSCRYAVGPTGTLNRDLNWFRTLVEPGGAIRFDQFNPGPHFVSFFVGSEEQPRWLDRLGDVTEDEGPDWHGLACELLPQRLLEELAVRTRDTPIELLISAHSALSLMPWAALKINTYGTRLIEHAIVAQVPVFTCLSGRRVPAVTGPAVVRLVAGSDAEALDVDPERKAWKLPHRPEGVPLSRCTVGPSPSPAEIGGTLTQALRDHGEEYGFAHIACHGGGFGFEQELSLPERLTAAEALTMHWPASVLMASCHVGRLFNVADDEPLSFVMALLTGGSRCVAAAIDEVPDFFTGRLAADMVEMVRAGSTRLDVALRRAQLDWLNWPEVVWALFSSYVR